MSKSYGNAINLSDSGEAVRKKVQTMVTDPLRVKITDPGHPESCNVFSYYQIFSKPDTVTAVSEWCVGAKKGCTDCKKNFADILAESLRPIHEQRARLAKDPGFGASILKKGNERASEVASRTMKEVKEVLHLYQT